MCNITAQFKTESGRSRIPFWWSAPLKPGLFAS